MSGGRGDERLDSIQVLRGLAAVGVVIYHANLAAHQKGYGLVPKEFTAVGMAGVDVFFVLSGFLMVWITRHHAAGARDAFAFLKRRAIRILPLYWLVTVLKLSLIAISAIWTQEYLTTFEHSLKSLLLIPSRGADGSVFPLVGAGWTLIYEWLFYVIFAICIFLMGRRAKWGAPVLVVACVLFGVTEVSGSIEFKFYTDSIIIEFVFGCAIAAFYQNRVLPASVAASLVGLGLALILASAASFGQDLPRVLKFGVPAALIVLGMMYLNRYLQHRWVQPWTILGEISYSLYLINQMIIAILVAALPQMMWGLNPMASECLLLTVLVTASLMGGTVLFYTVERPVLRSMAARDGIRRSQPLQASLAR
jgi:exopolysaccharide production protein ExoZ